jgi:hypothetical protein
MMKFSLDRLLCIVVIIITILFVAGIDDDDDDDDLCLYPLVQLIIDDLMTTQLLLPVL